MRTFFIHSSQAGTAVSLQHKGKNYLITASHLLPNDPGEIVLRTKTRQDWATLPPVPMIARCTNLDIAVLACPFEQFQDLGNLSLPLSEGGLVCGQHVHFLGFPLMMEEYIECGGMNDRPFPFSRGAIVSSMPSKKLVLDGMNNVGFSGGPVVFFKGDKHHVCGIITGYKEEMRDIEMPDEEWQAELKAIYKENTGITYATSASAIARLIDETKQQPR